MDDTGGGGGETGHHLQQTSQTSSSSHATAAIVAYLRAEADSARQKAKSLRAQADNLAAIFNVTQDVQRRYGE